MSRKATGLLRFSFTVCLLAMLLEAYNVLNAYVFHFVSPRFHVGFIMAIVNSFIFCEYCFAGPERRLKKGITWASIGMAVTLWFLSMGAEGRTIFGLIPLFLGLGWIAFYVVDARRMTSTGHRPSVEGSISH